MKLKMKIEKIKSIDTLEMEFPIEKGLYAITGQNGSGKSTVVTCASRAFYSMKMDDHFGYTQNGATIAFELNGIQRSWIKSNRKWIHTSNGLLEIKGFFEGSLVFGNRFRNATYQKLLESEHLNPELLSPASKFVRTNLGEILQGDRNFYEKLWVSDPKHLERAIYFYEKQGKRISQIRMSTGENLLISILNSLYIRNQDRENLERPCLFFLDEIEMALHPSSLKRLVNFLGDMAKAYNYAIYFSTHSIELIGNISPENIYFLDRHSDNSIEILNPCYPAYATRILYDHSGYDNIILVEDDLAKEIVKTILKRQSLLSNRLVHVLPCGGFAKVIDLAQDVTRNNLLGKIASICIILDGDIKEKAEQHIKKCNITNNIPLNYLPIESLEKYLKSKLYTNVDHNFFRKLNDYVFHQVSLDQILSQYKTEKDPNKDYSGKILYSLIDDELRARNIGRNEIIEIVINHLFDKEREKVDKIIKFLESQFKN